MLALGSRHSQSAPGAPPQASRAPAPLLQPGRARGQVTPGATFPEPSLRWGPGPGRGRTRSREELISRNKVAGSAAAAAAGRESQAGGGAAGRTCSAPSSSGERTPSARTRASSQEGGHAHPGGPAPSPASRASGAPLPPPTKGQARGGEGAGREEAEPEERAARAQSCGVAFPRRRGAGSRSLQRAFSRRGARRSLRLPKPIGESRGAVPPFLRVISADGKLSSVWQTWCLRARSRFALGLFCFCFWRNYGAGRLHKLGAFSVGCQKKIFFFFRILSGFP